MTKQSVKAPGPMVELSLVAYVIREIKNKSILVSKLKLYWTDGFSFGQIYYK